MTLDEVINKLQAIREKNWTWRNNSRYGHK